MRVPFLNLLASYEELQEEIDAAIAKCLKSGWYILGSEVETFEKEFAKYVGSDYCVGVANGLEALFLALSSLNIGPGDEVIVPSNTYIATWLAVSHTGATPIPVDPDEHTQNLDPSKIEAAITKKTKVILPVHLYGRPADLDSILEIAENYGLRIVDDAAQSHGARYKGKRIGSYSDATAWSFYPGKNLGAFGDGGAITTNNYQLVEKIYSLRNYGSTKKYINNVIGYNSRLDEIQAAILRVKLQYLDEWNARRVKASEYYSCSLKKSDIILPTISSSEESVWHLYVVRSERRDQLQKHLFQNDIETLIHYPIPPHMQRAYKSLRINTESFPVSNKLSSQILSLPIGPHLSQNQQDKVVDAIQSFFE